MFIWSANPVLIKKYNKNKEPIKALLIYSAITKGDIFITEEVMSFDEFLMASLTLSAPWHIISYSKPSALTLKYAI